MHVGGVAVIEGSLKFETFKQTIASRIHQIPKLRKKDKKLVVKEDRSVLAESLRILRTNINYIQRSHKSNNPNNLIFVTSREYAIL